MKYVNKYIVIVHLLLFKSRKELSEICESLSQIIVECEKKRNSELILDNY